MKKILAIVALLSASLAFTPLAEARGRGPGPGGLLVAGLVGLAIGHALAAPAPRAHRHHVHRGPVVYSQRPVRYVAVTPSKPEYVFGR